MAPVQELAQSLLERWRQEMLRLPLPAQAEVVEGEALKRLSTLAAALAEVAENEEAAERFAVGGDAYRESEELGRLRKQQGFTMEELVQEHIIMRNEFWNGFKEAADLSKAVDFHLEKRVNSCLDSLLQAAAAAYHYEYTREIAENPLRDTVTGLYNRSYFHGRMIEELRRSVRYGHELTLVLFEVADFQRLRQEEEEEGSSELLRSIASSITRMTRDCDVVASLGEGSFAILLPETGWRGGLVMSERLKRYLGGEIPSRVRGDFVPELSWGLASFPEEVRLPEKLYACAVEAMRSSRSLPSGEIAVYRGSESREEG